MLAKSTRLFCCVECGRRCSNSRQESSCNKVMSVRDMGARDGFLPNPHLPGNWRMPLSQAGPLPLGVPRPVLPEIDEGALRPPSPGGPPVVELWSECCLGVADERMPRGDNSCRRRPAPGSVLFDFGCKEAVEDLVCCLGSSLLLQTRTSAFGSFVRIDTAWAGPLVV